MKTFEIETRIAGFKYVVVEIGNDGRKRVVSRHETLELAQESQQWETDMETRETTVEQLRLQWDGHQDGRCSMTLDQWCAISEKVYGENTDGSRYVIAFPGATYYPLLWHLDDFRVAGITNGYHVNLVPKTGA